MFLVNKDGETVLFLVLEEVCLFSMVLCNGYMNYTMTRDLPYAAFIVLRCVPSVPSAFWVFTRKGIELCKGLRCVSSTGHRNLLLDLFALCFCVSLDTCISSGYFVKKRIAVSAGYHRQCSFQTFLISIPSLSFPLVPHIYQHLGILSCYIIHFVNLSFLHLSWFSLDRISFGLIAHYLFVQINICMCTLLSHQRQSYLSSSLSCTLLLLGFFFWISAICPVTSV